MHPNINTLILRMENSLEGNDFALVLKTSADIFETLAKDIVGIPAVQGQSLKSFFERYRQDSILPKEILDYILGVYDSRNKMPLAGHGSTNIPNITKEHAIILCELTKAFVNIEYRSREFKKERPSHIKKQTNATSISLILNEKGLETESDIELSALLTEALYAAHKGVPLKFDITYAPVVNIENILDREEFQNPSPEARITKVKILKLLDREKEKEKMINDALNLVSTESIINLLSTEVEYLIEIINGVPRILLYSIVENGMTGIDIFRKNTRLSARFT